MMTPFFILLTLQAVLTPALSPLFVGIIRKLKAKLQGRNGAGIFQPYRDLWKLFHKDEVISWDASWIFRVAPYIVFAVTVVVGASIPLFVVSLKGYGLGDLVSVVYLLALGTFFLALAGMDTGGAFGGFGSSREMTLAALTEGGLLFALLVASFLARSTNLFVIAGSVAPLFFVSFVPVLLAFSAFIIALLSETARFPFDNPATHLELTMVHEAMILEYSGKRLALMEWASANKLFIFLALGVNVFFPWGIASTPTVAAVSGAIIALLLKALIISAGIAVLESSIAKFRFFRLPDLLFASFLLSLIALNIIIITL
jgi:formate hydrogenlyase subunit 4